MKKKKETKGVQTGMDEWEEKTRKEKMEKTITEKKLKKIIHWYLHKDVWEDTKENNQQTKKAEKLLHGYVDGKILLLVEFKKDGVE